MTRKILLVPNNKLVDIFSNYWSEMPKQIQLFQDDEIIPVSENTNIYKTLDEISKYEKKDEEIESAEDLNTFLRKINSTYHTRVSDIDGIVKNLMNKKKIENVAMLMKTIKDGSLTLNDFICDICKDRKGGEYSYSFATKVFSFSDGDNFPIIDSLVSTLLVRYDEEYHIVSDDKGDKLKKTAWGDYSKYLKFYKQFKNRFDLSGTYKQIDKFLWTYATLMNAYWLDMGALNNSSVSFDIKLVK